jgi:hypothetical protein
MVIQFLLPLAWAVSLSGECYDNNSAKACYELSQKLSKGSASDKQRAEVARLKACKLGMSMACVVGITKETKTGSGPFGKSATPKPEATLEAARMGSDSMAIKRSEAEKHLENLPALLQDAAMEERKDGYEFTQIESKSVYETLGFKVGDTLMEINGHRVESPMDAMNLFVLLRDENNFSVKTKRAGKISVRKYTVTD